MSGADKGKQNLEEGAGTDKNKEQEAVPSSRRTPTRYSAADKGKQKTEEGTGADKNQEKEDEPSSRGEPTRYSAADKGIQTIEEGTAAAKLKAERDALLEHAELVRKMVLAEKIGQELEAAAHARAALYPAEGFPEFQVYFPDFYSHQPQNWHENCLIIVVVILVVFITAFLVLYRLHSPPQ